MLWWWCLKFAEDGDLSRYRSCQIPAIETDEFRAHLRTAGWIDGDLIHDWIDYAGLYLTKKYSTGNIEKLKIIWWKHGYKYGKGKGKFHLAKANRKRTESEQQANIPNLTRPNLTRPNQPVDGRIVSLKRSPRLESDDDFLTRLKTELCYQGIDVVSEWGKCGVWCGKNQKQRTQKRFVNWLNRIERPSGAHVETPFMRSMRDFIAREDVS